MIVVGLTGGIGSGKSTVTRLLAERGAVIVDADAIVHELQRPGEPLLALLAERFGPDVIASDGSLDRARLATVAFSTDDSVAVLNAIVHPAVAAEMEARVLAHAGSDDVVVVDIPLLKERDRFGMAWVIVVDTPVETAVARLVGQRAMSEADVLARIGKQISREERRVLADRVIDNSGDLQSLERQVDEAWAWMRTLPAAPEVSGFDIGLVVAFAVCAIDNWLAVAAPEARADRRRIARTKVSATVVLVAIAALAGDMSGAGRIALVVAVVLCLAGDALLLGTGEVHFLAGLAAFAAGHLAYLTTALLVGVEFPRLLVAVPFLVALFGFRFVTQVVPAARRRGGVGLQAAVVGYAAVIAGMVLTATGTPAWVAAAGAMMFAVSDWMIGYDRFVRPFPGARLAVMVTYHVGQILLIGGLIAGG